MLKRFAIVVIAGTLLSPAFAYSQSRDGSLQGVVKDSQGAPVTGAFVKIKNSERRLTIMVVSQPQGRFSISALPSGKYIAQAVGGDFQSELSAPVEISGGKPTVIDLALTNARAPQLAGAWPGRLPGAQVGEGGEGGEGGGPPAALPEGE